VKPFSSLHPPSVLAEFGSGSLRILDGTDGLELSLERADNGRLTAGCIQMLAERLRTFLGRKSWRSRPRVICAIGAQGVSLRRLTLPRASRLELERLVHLQIEREFPVPPEDLAWGYLPVGSRGHGAARTDEVLVAAIKHDLLQQYEEVFRGCELSAVFTISALVRPWACPPPTASATWGVLEVGQINSELMTLTGEVPLAIRTLPFGRQSVTLAIQQALGVSIAEAEKLEKGLRDPSFASGDATIREKVRTVVTQEVAAFAATLAPGWIQGRLLLTGDAAYLDGLPEALSRSLGPSSTCERLPLESGEGRSAAILGLRAQRHATNQNPPIVLRRTAPNTVAARNARNSVAWKWAALAAVLALACGFLRYVQPVFGVSAMTRQIAELKARQARLPAIDRDLAFLQNLRTNQPPYLDLIHTLADSSPSGTRLDSISLNRRGDFSVRATLPNADAVIGFRSKLDASTRFSSVVVDEQTPSPDQQKLSVRITGQRSVGGGRTAKAALPSVPSVPAAGTSEVKAARESRPPPIPTPPGTQATGGALSVPPQTNANAAAPTAITPTNQSNNTNVGRATRLE